MLVSPITGLTCSIGMQRVHSIMKRPLLGQDFITACFKQIFGDSELKIYREVAIFFAVYDLAIEGAFCYSHALRAQFLRM